MMKRGIAFILCLSMIFSFIVPVAFVFADTEVLSVEYDGSRIEDISISHDEKKVLSAVMGNSAPENCQWQILVDSENGIWADIYDKTTAECEISYALVKSILETSGKAALRCKVQSENGWIYSNEVEVRVTFDEKQPEETETEPVLVSDMEVIAFPEEEVFEETGEAEIFMAETSWVSAPVVFADGEGEETEYVTITIKYLDFECYGKDTEIAIYSSYVATIVKGSAFKQEVLSPTYLGFAPYYDANRDGDVDEDASVFYLDFAEGVLTEDIEYLVYYKPILVPYGVRYFFQNINDDLYTEKAEYYHTHEALTGTIIDNKDFDDCTEITKDTAGFELMYHIPDSVAADGSTVFELYYDRNYYLIQFDFAGGYGSDPIYARYDTPFVVNTPVKHGYVFKGWDLNGDGVEDPMPDTIPAENRKYTALWETADTTYTVVYWKENADDNGYSYWGYADEQPAKSGSLVSASDDIPQEVHDGEKVHFEFNEVLSDKNVLVEGDGTTIVNAYYTRKYYTITFKDTNYSCLIPGTHTHTDACYAYKCEGAHVHTNACIICGSEAHSHIDSCYVCGKEEHSHSEDCCTSTQHTHTVSCWANVGEKYNGTPQDYFGTPSQGQIYSYREWGTRYRFIYIGNSWYIYNGNQNSGTINPNCDGHVHGVDECNIGCGKEEHSHSDGCGTNCGKTAHVHNDSCYNCNFGTHTHDASCERIVCGYSETHTHTNSCKNTVKKVYKKYQQSLADIWPIVADNGKTYNSGERWDPSGSDIYNNVLVYISNMPGEDFTLSLSTSNNDPRTMNYYLQALPGESYDVEKDGKYYKLDFTIVAKYGYITEAEDFFDINGYKQYDSDPDFSNGQISDSTLGRYNDTANFYYDRITDHYLVFNNNGIVNDDDKVYGIPYGATINQHNFTPEYPKNLEPNAYEFAGWYTSPGCFPGTEVDWSTITMPVGDLILYAKWAPVDHEVLFFEDLDAMNAYIGGDTSVDVFEKHIVKHGEVIGPVEGPEDRWENPEDTGNDDKKLVFSGWYYIESGEKKAFTPADFPIKKDMKIFADWGGTTHTPFKISYITYENGEKVKVADDYTGFAIVGTTKTFNAKAGSPLNQLYPKYNDDAYFPLVASHSITMQYDSAKYAQDATVNVYEFEYVKAEIPIDYKVQYINKETGLSLLPDAEKNTTKAVVTERFRAINGYIPDAFYKRLVISVEYDEEKKEFVGNDEENVLIFYYTPNTTSAYYAVHFMLEKLDATDETRQQYNIDGTGGYEESGTHIEGIGDVKSTVKITPQTFPGFTLIGNKGIEVDDQDADGVIESGEMTTDKTLNTDGEYEIKITQNGTELYIFYSRNSYPYSVYYYLYNTEDPVPKGTDSNGNTIYQEHKTNIMAKYGSEVTEEAVKIPGYTCVSATEQSLLIREETAQNKNEIIFYYSPTKYTVEYKAVPPEGGTLSATIEVITGQKDFTGSAPTANPGWKFEGWYTNEECTVAVCDSDGTVENGTNKFVPLKSGLSETESNIFYAKFVPDVAPLTIVRKNPCDTDQVYVYKISWQNEDDQTESITVTISDFVKDENDEWVGSVTVRNLTLGKKYTVTQINDWSWRNSDQPTEITHEGNPDSEGNLQGTTVTFSDTEAKYRWLNGLSTLVKNIYGKLTVKQGGDADDE